MSHSPAIRGQILNDDDALDLFKKTLESPSLLQFEDHARDLRHQALAMLKKVQPYGVWEGFRNEGENRISQAAHVSAKLLRRALPNMRQARRWIAESVDLFEASM